MNHFLDIWRQGRSNPWKEFAALQRQMDRLFNDLYSPTEELRMETAFVPACDLEETEGGYLISVDVPGMTAEQIHVELSGNTLRVSGEKKEEKKEEKGAQRTYERYHGRFERTFTLPQVSDTEKVEAEYKNGVLSIAIPKTASSKPRKIQVNEGKAQPVAIKTAREEKKAVEKAA